jgi:hypothetical protein
MMICSTEQKLHVYRLMCEPDNVGNNPQLNKQVISFDASTFSDMLVLL